MPRQPVLLTRRNRSAVLHHEIARRFNQRFARDTVLIGGAEEPLYLPRAAGRPAIIRYTHDYPQSALHEVAHWCLAGDARRLLRDYGYWYQPPPRSEPDQSRFFAVESRVQGLELLFALAAGVRFHVSADNPGDDPEGRVGRFAAAVRTEAVARLAHGPRGRAAAVLDLLDCGWRHSLPRRPELALQPAVQAATEPATQRAMQPPMQPVREAVPQPGTGTGGAR